MDDKIGVVAEGPTDLVALQILLPAAVPELKQDSFCFLQPTMDRTSGEHSDGGWTKIQKWCLSNSPALRKRMISGGLFAGDPIEYDWKYLLVLIDTDICDQIEFQRQSDVNPGDYALSEPSGRAAYVKEVLRRWLWPDGVVADDLSWTLLASAVEAIETWLVVGLLDRDEPERIKDVGKELLVADHVSRGRKVPETAKRIKKRPERYAKIAKRAAERIENIKSHCPHFAELVDGLLTMLPEGDGG
ncbi:hypothetical protein C2E25_16440 [Geothermobacter hydrogeniphilus]|uniref:DUF4276 domain-containing protein n=1 Tax=Geothermobacter hydrogeniphilus TaxID=1969733 RepID=A0A2K2H5R5_9BACT|nr:hypothetical protein [Geothermobacter hydrogeniphilus]PNU18665.1 hypothetical protein C2E25_16440 [Geothermobacter hydrogeniphilus]